VFSDADREAPHVAAADHAVRIGPAPARESYLSIPALLEAAKKTRAGLVHPGYGFLAENAGFAKAVAGAGLTFVGPPASAIEAMGSKTAARERMIAAGVPVVPGMQRPASGAADIARFGKESGYPLLLKASAGGGGKGMRRVDSESEVAAAFERVSSEARSSFADGAVYAERLVERPRHVEVQVVADSRGSTVAVGERECSIQRRHQKVVEECPSTAVTPELRSRMCAAAVAAARAVGYVSCGTVEFLLDRSGEFYFLEMNTRLQVEHPVTEEVFGVDLAAEMIRIALGESLSIQSMSPRGHAIECRVYAEDPRHGFAPSPGAITALRLPQGPGIRNDVGVEAGSVVPIDYDPMLGKLIVHGADRAEAVSRLARALADYQISGVETTLPLFRRLVSDPEFVSASYDVQWLDRRLAEGLMETPASPPPDSEEDILLAAVAIAAAALEPARSRTAATVSAWRRAARFETLR